MWLALSSLAFGQAVDFECVPQTAAGEVVGLPPLTVDCELVVSDLYGFSESKWLLGDGTVLEGDRISHTYEEAGQYDIHLYLSDLAFVVGDTGFPDVPAERVKRGHVTACSPPEVEFTYIFKGGLTYQLNNGSDFLPGCVDRLKWSVYAGDGRQGAPIAVAEVWDARFELPKDGVYTFVLDMSGLAGAAAAKITVDAKYGLTEEIANHRSQACSTTSGGGALWLWLAGAFVVRRRRG